MWLVRLALRAPYTFVVMAVAILLLGAVSIARAPKDVFPEISEPVVTLIWQYVGIPADSATVARETGLALRDMAALRPALGGRV